MSLVKVQTRAQLTKTRDELKAQAELAYALADPNTQHAMAVMAQNFQNAATAESQAGLHKKDALRLEIDSYLRLLQLAQHKTPFSPVASGVAQTNFFGNYGQDGITSIGNEIAQGTFGKSGNYFYDHRGDGRFGSDSGLFSTNGFSTNGAWGSAGSGNAATSGAQKRYSFKWNNNSDLGYINNTMSLKERSQSFLNTLISNLLAAQEKLNEGYTIYGMQENTQKLLTSVIENLLKIKANSNNWEKPEDAIEDVKYLRQLAPHFNIPDSDFYKYFKEWEDENADFLKAAAVESSGYNFNLDEDENYKNLYSKEKALLDIIKNSDLALSKKGNDYYLHKKSDKSLLTSDADQAYLGYDDWGRLNGNGVYITKDGRVIIDTLANLLKEGSTYRDAFNAETRRLRDEVGKILPSGVIKEFGSDDYYTDDPLFDAILNSSMIVNNKKERMISGRALYVDISLFFSGNNKIVIVNRHPDTHPLQTDNYGFPIADGVNSIYCFIDNEGKLRWSKSIKGVCQTLGSGVGFNPYGHYSPDASGNPQLEAPLETNMEYWSPIDLQLAVDKKQDIQTEHAGTDLTFVTTDGNDFLNEEAFGDQEFMKWYLRIFTSNSNQIKTGKIDNFGKEIILNTAKSKSNISNALTRSEINNLDYWIYIALNYKPQNPNDKMAYRQFLLVLREYIKRLEANAASQVVSSKLGGVLKCASGTTLTDLEINKILAENLRRDDAQAEVKQLGYGDVKLYDDLHKGVWEDAQATTATVARIGAVAADLASLVTSFAVGIGSIASLGLGVGSSIANVVADVTEDGFLLKDLGNLGMNIVMDVAGLFGGAGKIAKITKLLAKLGTTLYASFSLMENGDTYIQSLKNLLTPGKKFTVEDLKLISEGLGLITGLTKTGMASYKLRQIKNNTNLRNSIEDGSFESGLEFKVKENGSTVTKKFNAQQVRDLVSAENKEDADAVLKNIFGDNVKSISNASVDAGFLRNRWGSTHWAASENPYSRLVDAWSRGHFGKGPQANKDIVTDFWRSPDSGVADIVGADNLSRYYNGPFRVKRGVASQGKYAAGKAESDASIKAAQLAKSGPSAGSGTLKIADFKKLNASELGAVKDAAFKNPKNPVKNTDNMNKAIQNAVNLWKNQNLSDDVILRRLQDPKMMGKIRSNWNKAHATELFRTGGRLKSLEKLQQFVNNNK